MRKKKPNKNASSPKKEPRKVSAEISSPDPLEVKITEAPKVSAEISPPKDPLEVKVIGPPRDRTSWVAIIIALIALILTVVTTCQNRKHNRVSVKPIITFEKKVAFEGKQGIYMVNAGLGTAIIKSIAMIHINDIRSATAIYGDKKKIESWDIEGGPWVLFEDPQNVVNFLGKLLKRIPSVEELREKSESEYNSLGEQIKKIDSSKPELIPFSSRTMQNMVFPVGESMLIEVDNEVLEKFVEELNSDRKDEKPYFKANIIKKELGETLSYVIIEVEYEDLYGTAMEPALRLTFLAKQKLKNISKNHAEN